MQFWNNSNMAQNLWCVYTLTQEGCNIPDFTWYCKFANITAIADAIKNPDYNHAKNYLVNVISFHNTRIEASNAQGAWMKQHGMPPLNLTQMVNRFTPVICENTGVQYRNAAEVCSALGINRSQLSQHLRRKPGYKTVKGMTFINRTEAHSVKNGKPVQAVQYPAKVQAQPAQQVAPLQGRLPVWDEEKQAVV